MLAFLDAAGLVNMASMNSSLHALANDGALWCELLLAERPHLAPLLPLMLVPGVAAAKDLYCERMV